LDLERRCPVREKLVTELSGDDDIDTAPRTCGLVRIAKVLHPREGRLAGASGQDGVVLRVKPIQLDRCIVVHDGTLSIDRTSVGRPHSVCGVRVRVGGTILLAITTS
jgi:hypothetical protein